MLPVKLTEYQVEIFLELERLEVYPRCRNKDGRRIKATPQKFLSHARYLHADLHQLVFNLLNADV